MRNPAACLFAILFGALIWFVFQHFKFEGDLTLVPKSAEEIASDSTLTADKIKEIGKNILSRHSNDDDPDDTEMPVAESDTQTKPAAVESTQATRVAPRPSPTELQIGSFHLAHLDADADDVTMQVAASIVSMFDVTALQGVTSTAAVRELTRRAGVEFELLLGAPADVFHQDTQFAFIFNKNTLEADRGDGFYTLGDPENLFYREPLVGWFRSKEAEEKHAFTFSLVNVDVDVRRVTQELDLLDNVMHEVRNDGRMEDDVIMLGTFHAPSHQLGELGTVRSLLPALNKVPTELVGESQKENVVFRSSVTNEYTGRSGAFQFLRAYNLDVEQARRVSNSQPVWAEFSIYEGGAPGRVAQQRATNSAL